MDYHGACRLQGRGAAFIAEESSAAVAGSEREDAVRVSDTRSLYVFDLQGGPAKRLHATQQMISLVIGIPDTSLFWSHSSDGLISLWSAKQGEALLVSNRYPADWQKITAIAWDNASHRLCFAGQQAMELWQLTWRAPWGFSLPLAERWR